MESFICPNCGIEVFYEGPGVEGEKGFYCSEQCRHEFEDENEPYSPIVRHLMRLPTCCRDCQRLDSVENKWEEHVGWKCTANVVWPTRKGTCKRQKPRG